MEGTIIIRGGEAAMQDRRAQSTIAGRDAELEAIISIEANCKFAGILDKARVLSSMMDAFCRDPMERMLMTVAFMELEKRHMASDDKDREQIVFPGDKNSPDGFSDVGMLKSLFDRLQRDD